MQEDAEMQLWDGEKANRGHKHLVTTVLLSQVHMAQQQGGSTASQGKHNIQPNGKVRNARGDAGAWSPHLDFALLQDGAT